MVAVHCAFDEMMPIESVIPNPRNPNTHPDKQIKLLAKIINTQGWRAPITVSKRSGFIVRGHGRLLAAQLLNLETVPVDLQDYESEAAEWADLIADNRLAELATIDDSLLAELLKEADDMVELTGYTANEIDRILGEAESSVVQDDNFDVEGAVDSATKDTITQQVIYGSWGIIDYYVETQLPWKTYCVYWGGTKRTWYLRTRHIMLPMRAAPA